MKKRILSLILGAAMAMSLAACGGTPAEGSSTDDNTTSAPKADGQKYEITLSSHQATSSPHQWVIEQFKERVEAGTNGNVVVNLFPGGTLGNARDNLEGVQMGSIQMCLADTGATSNLCENYNVLQLPFLFRDYDHLNKVLAGDIVKEKMDNVLVETRGIRPLGWYPDGLRDFLLKKPVHQMSDFKGMKIRAMETDLVIDTINTLGAAATPIPWNEVYSSMQTNVVEGMEAAPTSIYAMKFHEVADNLILSEHINLGVTLMINEQFFQSLPEEYQKVIQDSMAEIAAEQSAKTVEQMDKAVEDLAAAGVNVIEIDKSELVDAVQPLWEKYGAKIDGGQEVIDAIVAVQ